jgi:hypothetical protein
LSGAIEAGSCVASLLGVGVTMSAVAG